MDFTEMVLCFVAVFILGFIIGTQFRVKDSEIKK